MVRRALTYHLILAVAVGPLLCCCTAGRLLASTPAGPSPAQLASSPAPRITHTCCAHKHKPAKSDADEGHRDPKPAPPKPGEKCPCKGGTSKAKTAQTETLSAAVSTVLRALTLDLLSPFLTVDTTACPNLAVVQLDGSPGGGSVPLSTADLLYAHHNLRC